MITIGQGRTLGAAPVAQVRYARNISTLQHATVKIFRKRNIHAGSLRDPDMAEPIIFTRERKIPPGVEREVAIIKIMKHPNILKLIHVCESPAKM
jgi:serine/threonine protein kinase